jgi:hypothetical protein
LATTIYDEPSLVLHENEHVSFDSEFTCTSSSLDDDGQVLICNALQRAGGRTGDTQVLHEASRSRCPSRQADCQARSGPDVMSY